MSLMSIYDTPRPTVRRAAPTADGPTPDDCASCAFGQWPETLTDAFRPAWRIFALLDTPAGRDAWDVVVQAHDIALEPAKVMLAEFHAAGHPRP